MIYYNEAPPMGLFNHFINDRCLEQIAAFIAQQMPEHISEWGIPSITAENALKAEMASIRLDRSRSLYVSGDTLFFCCTFSVGFYTETGKVNIDDAEGTMLDVVGKILFHPPGTKKYDLTLSGIHVNYPYPHETDNYIPHFPGVRVSQNLHPAFGANEEGRNTLLEKEAERFLRQYCPEALAVPCAVPIREIAEGKMGLHVFTEYKLAEAEEALGLTVFRTKRLAVTDEDTAEHTSIAFPRGSIVIDADTVWNRGYGSFNYTLAHEVYHWYAHRVHMAFMDIMGKPDDYPNIKAQLESQANGVAARILMPREAVAMKYTEAIRQVGSYSDHAADVLPAANAPTAAGEAVTAAADTYELAVAECAAFFMVSKTAMKIRLHELGLHEEVRKPAVRRRLDVVEMFEQYTADKTFRNLLDSGTYRYIRGFTVRNEPKYICGDSLTPYAKEHLHECTLTFSERYRGEPSADDSLLFRKDEYFSRTADYDRRMAENPELMKETKSRLRKQRERYVSSMEKGETFCDYVMPIITEINTKYMGLDVKDEMDDGLKEGKLIKSDNRYRNRYFEHYDFLSGETIRITEPEVFQDKTLIHYKKFEEMRRNKWNNPDLDMVMALCAGYHLDMETTENALLHAGYLLLQHIPRHLAYRFLVSHCRGLYTDTDTFNTLLILLGEKEIGTNKRKERKGKRK